MTSAPAVFEPDPPRVEAGLRQARQLVGEFVDRPAFRFTDGEVVANLRALSELGAVVEAARLVLIAELGARPDALPTGGRARRAGRVVRFLTEALRQSRARAERDV